MIKVKTKKYSSAALEESIKYTIETPWGAVTLWDIPHEGRVSVSMEGGTQLGEMFKDSFSQVNNVKVYQRNIVL